MVWRKGKMRSVRRSTSPTPESHDAFGPFFQDHSIPDIEEMKMDPEYWRKHKGEALVLAHLTKQEYFLALEYATSNMSWETGLTEDNIKKYTEMMRSGVKFNTPWIDYKRDRIKQEGRHRVIAATRAGADKVPVYIIYPTDPDEYRKRLDKMAWKVRHAVEIAEASR